MKLVHDMLTTQEEIAKAQRIEQVRRQGYNFIKVWYDGWIVPAFDSTGVAINVRIHDVNDVIPFETTDPDTGKKVLKTRLGSKVLEFESDPATGDTVSLVLDDDFNRQFLANHIDEIHVYDEKIAAEIKQLVGKEYIVSEVSRKDELIRQKKALEKELNALSGEPEVPIAAPIVEQGPVKAPVKRRAKRRRISKKVDNGNDKRTADMDRVGVSRVAEGGESGKPITPERSPQDAAPA